MQNTTGTLSVAVCDIDLAPSWTQMSVGIGRRLAQVQTVRGRPL